MMHLLQDVIKHFVFDDPDIDNWIFKLFYKGSFVLFLMGSMVGILSQYFGEPINCDFKGIDSEMASDYCWIHGSSYIPPEYQKHMRCIVDHDGVESADDAPDTSYYQWVTFVMMIQAGTFMLPKKIWTALEGGLMEEFGQDAKSKVILTDEFEEAVLMEAQVDKYLKFFRSVWHRNNWYFSMFVLCEVLNCIVLFFNFWCCDVFLNGKFYYYGWDVIQYARMSKEDKEINVDPFCSTFPLEVSCTVPNVGAAGGPQNHNGLCVLSQNVINEKMYLAVWFWTVFLIFIVPIFILYRICTIIFQCMRSVLLMSKIGNTNDASARKAVSYVVSKCYVGDWFVLYQISKNVNMYFFRVFIKELRKDMKLNPKKQNLPKVLNVNHVLPGKSILSQSEIDEDEDKFEDIEQGETNLNVDIPEETDSLISSSDINNAPTLALTTATIASSTVGPSIVNRKSGRRGSMASRRSSQAVTADETQPSSSSARLAAARQLHGPGGRLGRGRLGGKLKRGMGGKRGGGRRGGRKGGGMGGMGMGDMEAEMAMMMY